MGGEAYVAKEPTRPTPRPPDWPPDWPYPPSPDLPDPAPVVPSSTVKKDKYILTPAGAALSWSDLSESGSFSVPMGGKENSYVLTEQILLDNYNAIEVSAFVQAEIICTTVTESVIAGATVRPYVRFKYTTGAISPKIYLRGEVGIGGSGYIIGGGNFFVSAIGVSGQYVRMVATLPSVTGKTLSAVCFGFDALGDATALYTTVNVWMNVEAVVTAWKLHANNGVE